jgi:hypothetical protein
MDAVHRKESTLLDDNYNILGSHGHYVPKYACLSACDTWKPMSVFNEGKSPWACWTPLRATDKWDVLVSLQPLLLQTMKAM